MFGRKLLNVIAVALLIISVPLILLLVNIYVLFTPSFLQFEYGRPTFPQSPGFTEEERLGFARALLVYMRSDQGISSLQALTHDGEPLLDTRELVHMADAKRLLEQTLSVFWGAVIVFALTTVFVLRRPELWGKYPAYVFWGAVILFVGILSLAAWAGLAFDSFFYIFHRIFFVGDSGFFLASDSLIRLLPEVFWSDGVVAWVILALGEAVVVGSAAYLWPGWKHEG